MKTQIREYNPKDIEAIVTIINYYILNSTGIYDYSTRTIDQQKELFEEKLKNGFPIIVAVADGKVIGFGYYSEFRMREAYKFTVEHSVYVSIEHQEKGIGKLLLEELIVIAKNKKLHSMIGVIDSENTNSIVFHEKFGFTKVGYIKESGYKFDRWLHSVFMQLLLE